MVVTRCAVGLECGLRGRTGWAEEQRSQVLVVADEEVPIVEMAVPLKKTKDLIRLIDSEHELRRQHCCLEAVNVDHPFLPKVLVDKLPGKGLTRDRALHNPLELLDS